MTTRSDGKQSSPLTTVFTDRIRELYMKDGLPPRKIAESITKDNRLPEGALTPHKVSCHIANLKKKGMIKTKPVNGETGTLFDQSNTRPNCACVPAPSGLMYSKITQGRKERMKI